MLYTILVFAPLLGALVAGLFGRLIGDRPAQIVTCALMAVSAACAVASFFLNIYGEPHKVVLFDWIVVGSFDSQWALRIDGLSATGVEAQLAPRPGACCVELRPKPPA